MEGDDAVLCDFLRGSAAHVVIGTFHAHAVVVLGKEDGAVLGVIGHVPDARACLDSRLVAVCIVGWGEGAFRFFDGGVLVELVGGVYLVAVAPVLHAAVANVVVIPAVKAGAVHYVSYQLAAVVVGVGIVPCAALAGDGACRGTAELVVGVGALCYEGIAAVVVHLREEVSVRLVGLGECHAVGLGERLQQVRALQVSIREQLFLPAVEEARAADAAIGAVGCGDGLLGGVSLGVATLPASGGTGMIC